MEGVSDTSYWRVAIGCLVIGVLFLGALPAATGAPADEQISLDGDDLDADGTGEVELVVLLEAESAVGPDDPASVRSFEAYVERTDGVTVEQRFDAVGSALVTVDTDRVDPEELAAVDGVERVTENRQLEVPDAEPVPVDEPRLEPASHGEAVWGVERVGAPSVWDDETRGEGARVAVLDTGVDPEHPDIELAEGGWAEFDANGNPVPSDPYDADGHGTQVSSIATGGNASGSHIGVAPEAELLVGGVFTPEGGSTASLFAGIDWAIKNDADVISISLGSQGFHGDFVEPVRRAHQQGVVVVSAVGNDGRGASRSPANVYESLAVGAVTADEGVRSDSAGEVIETEEAWADPPADWPDRYVVPDLVAPGEDLRAADSGGGYARVEQTSMAAPHAAGAAALLHSADPSLSPAETNRILSESAAGVESAPAGPDPRYGHGVLDIEAAVDLLDDLTTLEGTVTDEQGSSVAGATVTVDGLQTVTNENGTYSVRVPAGAASVRVEGFGITTHASNVTVAENGTEHDVVVETEPAVEVVSGTPETVQPGTSFDLAFRVAAVERYTPALENDSTANVTLEDYDLDGANDLDDVERGDVVTVTVETAPGAVGDLGLAHSFEAVDGRTVEERTSTTVLVDPITVGTNGTVASIDAALDLAVDGSTIELVDDRYEHQADGPLVVEDAVRLTAAEGAASVLTGLGAGDERGDVGLAIQADDVVLSGVGVNATDADIGVHVVNGTGLVVANASIRAGSIGLGTESAVDRIADTDVTAGEGAVAVAGDLEEFVGNELSAGETDLVVERYAQVGSVAKNAFVGEGVGIAVEDSSISSVEGNRFEGVVGVEVANGNVSSTRNDYSSVADVALRGEDGTITSDLDYFGSNGPDDSDLKGTVHTELFLTSPPAGVSTSHADLQHFGYRLELTAGKPTTVAFPAPIANDLETTFGEFDGTIYEYRNGKWKPVNDPSRTPDALEAFVVVPEEDATAFVEFAPSDDDTVIPSAREVETGWNFVGAPIATDPDTAFAASSAAPARLLNPYAAPAGSPLPSGDDDWLTYTFDDQGPAPVLDPHAAYFVYATEDGAVGANAYPGVTLGELHELLAPAQGPPTDDLASPGATSVEATGETNATVTG